MIIFEIDFKRKIFYGVKHIMGDNNTKKPITIYDIAAEAGVSPATVSRVLTNNAKVQKDKRDRILALIEKYNFKPNALARGLSDTKTKLIGIITADVRNPFYSAVYVACETAAWEHGYRVLLCNSLGDGEREIEQIHMLVQQRVDAIIQIGGRVDALETDKSFAEETGKIADTIPFVVSGKIDGVKCYSVRIDAREAATLLAEHLIQLGHERIAFVGGRTDVASSVEKMKAYREVLEKHGLSFRSEYCIEGGYDYETGYNGTKALLGLKEIPTAIIAINDFAAAGVVRGITEMGLSIPGDMSVVSYDNTYITDLVVPKLTSIDYDYEKLGKKLVDTAISAANGEKVPTYQPVGPSLVVRKSSGLASKR